MNSSVESSRSTSNERDATAGDAILVREAGRPFESRLPNDPAIDPIVEWIGLMEVVQMLCPEWPVRDKPMSGSNWKL